MSVPQPPNAPAPGWLHASLQAARDEAARVPAWARRVLAAREAGVFPNTPREEPEMTHTDCPTCDAPRWRPLQLDDDVRRLWDCARACFHEDAWVRGMARWDWLMFSAGVSFAASAGFLTGAWVAVWLR